MYSVCIVFNVVRVRARWSVHAATVELSVLSILSVLSVLSCDTMTLLDITRSLCHGIHCQIATVGAVSAVGAVSIVNYSQLSAVDILSQHCRD